ncbi:hypothetical protein AB4084_13295, partial [Lysobacter sp. 2RAB21]
MKTGKAVMVSVALVAAAAAVLGGAGYALMRKLEQPYKVEVKLPEPKGQRTPAANCSAHDENAKAKAILAPVADALQR